MIDRIVLFKLKDAHANAAGRAAIADESRAALCAVPGAVQVRVGVPADEASTRSWDLSVLLRFEDLAAMEAYLQQPGFRAYFEDTMGPRTEVVKYWCFEVR